MEQIITSLGRLAALYLAYRTAKFVLGLLYRRLLSRPADPRSFGRWAVITGATDGIGRAYALALAKAGLDIVLISRTQAKLQKVAAEIEGLHKVKTRTVAVDFKEDDKSYVSRIEKELSGLEIGVLINNVGMFYKYPVKFLDIEGEGETPMRDLINVNITSVNAMTRIVLPSMLARKSGAIINIGSITALLPPAMVSVYAATKAYVIKLSESLDIEYGNQGITVQCVNPGIVMTNMTKLDKPTLIRPTAEAFVASAIGRLGIEKITNGYWSHSLVVAIMLALPKSVADKFSMATANADRRRMITLLNKRN